MTYTEQYAYYVSLIESALNAALAQSQVSDLLLKSMDYSIHTGGKRLRPVLCLAACELGGGMASDALKAACALEMIHTYSLIHDDLPSMDNDDFRRGKPSNHKVFGEGNAILAGDGLLSLAFQMLSQCGNWRAFQVISRGALDMVCGQSLDINDRGTDKRLLFEIHKKKTGALMRASLLSGLAIGTEGNVNKLESPLSAFADFFGLLFQITDDILDAKEAEAAADSSTEKGSVTPHIEHTSFVSLYGMEPACAEAKIIAENALTVLAEMDADTGFLRELTLKTLNRTF